MKKYIPNILTTLRMLLVPVFIYIIFLSNIPDRVFYSTLIFILASITDYFDGMLARKYNVISDYGKIMDPLADKLLVISALIVLALKLDYISNAVVIVILIREVLISFFREYFARKNIVISANIWGKIKTLFQMIGISLILVYQSIFELFDNIPPFSENMLLCIEIYFWLVAVLTWFSGIEYYKTLINMRKKNG